MGGQREPPVEPCVRTWPGDRDPLGREARLRDPVLGRRRRLDERDGVEPAAGAPSSTDATHRGGTTPAIPRLDGNEAAPDRRSWGVEHATRAAVAPRAGWRWSGGPRRARSSSGPCRWGGGVERATRAGGGVERATRAGGGVERATRAGGSWGRVDEVGPRGPFSRPSDSRRDGGSMMRRGDGLARNSARAAGYVGCVVN